MKVRSEALSRGGTWDRADESDIFVALTRSAIIIAIVLSPTFSNVQTPRHVQMATIVAAVYTLALFISRLAGRWLPLQRPLAIAVDIYLITTAVLEWGDQSRAIFQLYYIVVIVAAMWFGRTGGIVTAVAALGAYVWAEMAISEIPLQVEDVLNLLWYQGAPILVILAFVSSYVLRAREIERSRGLRLSHELELARGMQRQMLPDALPAAPGYELAVRLEVARVVSGDLYDFLRPSEDNLVVWVGDVAGKGVYGMMHVSMMHSHLQTAAMEGLSPAAIADRVNRGVYDAMEPSSFASAFIAELHLPTGRLTYTNCGHPHPLLLRDGGTDDVQRLHTNTPLVGIATTPAYRQLTIEMRPADVLVMTTDGVQEARAPDGGMFGEDRLLEVLAGLHGSTASEVATEVMRAVRQFSGGEFRDDAIVAVIRREPG
ncbi:MAG: PP2C family protein-serine/threonine phosphatase [Armatimonadota bacterium]|nr:PP2C family protein-serine/threonine phosphatase [Armatimonadota bacterium]